MIIKYSECKDRWWSDKAPVPPASGSVRVAGISLVTASLSVQMSQLAILSGRHCRDACSVGPRKR